MGPQATDHEGYLINDTRPRNIMVPIGKGYSVVAALGNQLLPAVREVCP